MSTRPLDPAIATRGTAEDPRLGSRLVDASWDVAIIGCADDTGVANSGGRTGAAQGPTEIRRWLYKQTTGLAGELDGIAIHDAGDVLPGGSIEETHRTLEEAIAKLAQADAPIVFLGGGHDLAYATHAGLLAAIPGKVAILNVDTHLDVRPNRDGTTVTSGTPFRRIIERWGDRIGGITEVGIQPQHNARAHAEWLRARRGRIVTLEELRQAPGVHERLRRELDTTAAFGTFATVSLDLDVVAASAAPGVSAPPADGLMPDELVGLMDRAGRHPKVRLLDVVELSPPHDENGRTARLAALCIWRFLAGLTKRAA